MNRLAVFAIFFIAAWFIPAWPLLLGVGIVWLIAVVMSNREAPDSPPNDDRGATDEPPPAPAPDSRRAWRPYQRTPARMDSKPFSHTGKR